VSGLELAMVALVVPDYDEAIAHYCGDLGFTLVENTELSPSKRWVVVAPGAGARLLLAKAASDEQAAAIGKNAGGRVGLFLHTDAFDAVYARYADAGVVFLHEQRHESYGRVAVFADRYGNKWDLIEPA